MPGEVGIVTTNHPFKHVAVTELLNQFFLKSRKLNFALSFNKCSMMLDALRV